MFRSAVRPVIHITAPCWINDPCAPGYDARTGLYHLFYQCNPTGTEWGNMSWGHVTSPDLLTWFRSRDQPYLKPDQEYDNDGVFTGCLLPSENSAEGHLTVFYSSVRHLPFHWSTMPYPRDAAGVAIATSSDGGRTWAKLAGNPILPGEPPDIAVTGFRDPYIAAWPAMDKLRGSVSLYGMVSGGIQGRGPTAFLYAVNPNKLEDWKYLCSFIDLSERFQPSKRWTGNYGMNWECCNFITLEAESTARHCLIMGAEGDVERNHIKGHSRSPVVPTRTVRCLLWMFGNLVKEDDAVRFHYARGGYLDHGSLYAASTFIDPVSQRRIMHAWIPEEDITSKHAQEKGWNGALCIPRELFLFRMDNVTGALGAELSDIGSVEIITEADGSKTLYTMGLRPICEMRRLRETSTYNHQSRQLLLPQSTMLSSGVCTIRTPCWELETYIALSPNCSEVGIRIQDEVDPSVLVSIVFSPREQTISVNRAASTRDTQINTGPESGPFTLFYTAANSMTSTKEMEKLHLHIFFDGDILEVFANDRFALATTVYSQNYWSRRAVSAFAAGVELSASFEELRVWDGLNGCKSLVEVEGNKA